MELFASPLACSLASHIAVIEAGLPVKVRFVENKKTDDGGDFLAVSPYGYVPALKLDDGQGLNEGASVLHYLGTEVHKRVFYNLFSTTVPAAAKTAAMADLEPTLAAIARRLGDRETLVGDRFTVADAYLLTLLNWAVFLKADLAKWPALQAYHRKHLQRPSVARAMGVEMEERKRRTA